MPGRFPLTPVALANDPFCTDAFCGEGGGGDQPHTTSPIGEVPRAGVGLDPGGSTFCGGEPQSIRWYKDGVLLSTTVGGVLTYESGAERPSWLGLLGQGVLLIKVGDEGATYTSVVTCTDDRTQSRQTVVQPGLLERGYEVFMYGYPNPDPFKGSRFSAKIPGYVILVDEVQSQVFGGSGTPPHNAVGLASFNDTTVYVENYPLLP